MINEIKNRIETELRGFPRHLDRTYGLTKISPVIISHIADFLCRSGKRVRPILFVLGYKGFSKRNPRGLYTSALSLELLHDFMLVHDDVIDKSELRRGKPAMHTMFNRELLRQHAKFSGEDLAIVIGDIMYAMGIHAFLEIDEDKGRKEKALRRLNQAALYTGCGEFIELLYGLKKIKNIRKEDIYKIYDFKTAHYTFASPLAMGATVAGAGDRDADALLRYGISLGRAFQIKDDILGLFGSTKEIGKSVTTDLQEAKKTILIWYAYTRSTQKVQKEIMRVLAKDTVSAQDLRTIRGIVRDSGALDFSKHEIHRLIVQAQKLLNASGMDSRCKNILQHYSEKILGV